MQITSYFSTAPLALPLSDSPSSYLLLILSLSQLSTLYTRTLYTHTLTQVMPGMVEEFMQRGLLTESDGAQVFFVAGKEVPLMIRKRYAYAARPDAG